MNKIEQIINDLKLSENYSKLDKSYEFLKSDYESVKNFHTQPGVFCGIDELSGLLKWKKGFAYLFTGSPNAGKSTMVLFLYLLMSLRNGYKWCIWSPEMEDYDKSKIHHVRDIINTLVWTLSGKTPYENYAKSHMVEQMNEADIKSLTNWVNEHFIFLHMNNRTPSAIIEGFNDAKAKFNVDGFLIDPWKSVKQIMNMRSDLWL